MKKYIRLVGTSLVMMLVIISFVACDNKDKDWYQKDYWIGCYSEIITREYSEGNVTESQLSSVSPNGEREVQFEIILALYNDKAYFSHRIIGSDNSDNNFILEGSWYWYDVNDFYWKRDGFVKEIRFYEDENSDWYTFIVSKEGGLYYLDEHRTGSTMGQTYWARSWQKLY